MRTLALLSVLLLLGACAHAPAAAPAVASKATDSCADIGMPVPTSVEEWIASRAQAVANLADGEVAIFGIDVPGKLGDIDIVQMVRMQVNADAGGGFVGTAVLLVMAADKSSILCAARYSVGGEK